MKKEKIITVMQARRGSSRFPDKVLQPVLEKPLFLRQVERIEAANRKGIVVVATTNNEVDDVVCDICEQENIEYFRGDASDLLDRHYKTALKYNADIVLKIPSDCPLIDPAIIDNVINHFLNNYGEYDYVSNLHPATFPDGNDVEVMTFDALENAWKHADKLFEREHTTPYIWEHPEQFCIGNVIMENAADYSMSHRFTIDYKEDYEFIKTVFEELYPANPLFTLSDILTLMDRRKDIFEINHHLAGVNWYRNHLDELKTVSHLQTKILEN